MSKTEHYDKIWSHAANQNYRDGVDAMLCAVPSCKRWRESGDNEFCASHSSPGMHTAPEALAMRATTVYRKERTFGKKTQGGATAPKHRAAKASPKGCDMASHAPPGQVEPIKLIGMRDMAIEAQMRANRLSGEQRLEAMRRGLP